MTTVLVTGGTGTLGSPAVDQLRAADYDVRVLSRRNDEGLTTGDLLTGEGIADAVADVDTIVHLSTGKSDVDAASNLLTAARASGVGHIVLISIVGIDDIPLPYYRGKIAIEKLVSESTVPFTIQRSTQFHTLIARIFAAQRVSPAILAPSFQAQPIDPAEVASRLVSLVGASPAGRIADIGGPETRSLRDLAAIWVRSMGSRRPVWPLRLPGKTFAGFAAGGILVPGDAYGRLTFEEFLSERAANAV